MRLLGNRFLVHSPGSFLSEWSSVCRSRVFLAARWFCPLTPHVCSLACLLALALAVSLVCQSLACLVACFLGQASISLPMVCAGLRSFGAGLSAPLLKCALAPQREPCRMRALICPRADVPTSVARRQAAAAALREFVRKSKIHQIRINQKQRVVNQRATSHDFFKEPNLLLDWTKN